MPTALIYADKDSWVSDAQPTTPASMMQNQDDPGGALQVYTSFSALINNAHQSPNANGGEKDSLIGFPASIPAGSIISAATLGALVKNGNTGGTVRVQALPGTDFDEANHTWNSWGHGHPTHASAPSLTSGNWMTWNVLGVVSAGVRNSFLLWSMGPANQSADKAAWFQQDFYPSEAGTAQSPYLSVTYSSAPGAPGSISTPAAGSTHDMSINLFAGAASDPDTPAGSLQYEWSYSPDGGTNWTVIPGLTAAGTTAKTWNTSALAMGNNYKVRLRAWDGSQWGPYTTMAGVFSIVHTAQVKIWNGAAWVLKNLWRWNGAAWVSTKLKRWNGSSWITE